MTDDFFSSKTTGGGVGEVPDDAANPQPLKKEKAMKKFAQAVLYVSSIVVAIAIGMGHVGKESRGDSDRAGIFCPWRFKDSRGCFKNLYPPSQPDCNLSTDYGYAFILSGGGSYWDDNIKQCGVHLHVFIADPRCETEFLTPVSDGCSE